MKPTAFSVVLVAAICFIPAARISAQQSSTNNNDTTYTTLGRRSTSINQDNGSQPHLGAPTPNSRPAQAEPTNAGPGIDVGPFGSSQVIDGDFVAAGINGALIEIELGNIAAQKAQSDKVRKFAASVSKGHERMRGALESMAAEHNLKYPKQLDAKRKARIDAIAKLSGTDFDRAYLRHVSSYYERSLGRFDFEASNGTIPELSAWAGRVIPRIRHEIKAVKEDLRAMQAPRTASVQPAEKPSQPAPQR
jgi:putative membrane protein